ncbi:MAG TPA: lysophospholipase, partial [Anaerolineae bacterium]|nr:lysophospholipase [Anaerolineae bacterium]
GDYLPAEPAQPGITRPVATSVPGWAVSPAILTDGAQDRRPAVQIAWDPEGCEDATGLTWEVRLSGGTDAILTGSYGSIGAGVLRIAEGILAGTAYEVRARLIVDRPVNWTAWTAVTAPAVLYGLIDLNGDKRQVIALGPLSVSSAVIVTLAMGPMAPGWVWKRGLTFEVRNPSGIAWTLILERRSKYAVLAQAEQRFPGKPRFLYGHSLGGNEVLNYALRRRPDLAGVVSTSPGLRTAFQPPALQLAAGRLMNRIWPAFTMPNGLELAAISRDPAVVAAYQADPLVHDRLSARLGMSLLESGEWAIAHAAEFPLPLLLMHGTADRLTSAPASQQFAAQAPNCTLKLWEGLYHETHNEPEKEEVIGFVVDWLQRHRGELN